MTTDELERLVGKAGMYTDLMRQGAASLVYSPGCQGVALDELKRFAELAIEADRRLRAVPGDMVLVPREPTEAMWGGLARDIVWFLYSTSAPHRGVKFYKWLENMGREVPEWLRAEVPDVNHSPSKGTWAVCIFKAMLEGAAAPTAAPAGGADEVPDLGINGSRCGTHGTSGS